MTLVWKLGYTIIIWIQNWPNTPFEFMQFCVFRTMDQVIGYILEIGLCHFAWQSFEQVRALRGWDNDGYWLLRRLFASEVPSMLTSSQLSKGCSYSINIGTVSVSIWHSKDHFLLDDALLIGWNSFYGWETEATRWPVRNTTRYHSQWHRIPGAWSLPRSIWNSSIGPSGQLCDTWWLHNLLRSCDKHLIIGSTCLIQIFEIASTNCCSSPCIT